MRRSGSSGDTSLTAASRVVDGDRDASPRTSARVDADPSPTTTSSRNTFGLQVRRVRGPQTDLSLVAGATAPGCAWCKASLSAESRLGRARRADVVFCSARCRQTAFRLRRRRNSSLGPNEPVGLTFAYADPPYPGLAKKNYGKEPTYAGEVDHRELVMRLASTGYAGWALSTSSAAVRDVLPLCPPGARLCAWVKPGGVPRGTYGLHSKWEALIVVGGRMRSPGLRDWLRAHPARGGGKLTGRKPLAFCAWLFECLGMLPGDHLVDLFPGTGIVTRAWRELGRPRP